jgi:UDP-N-acetylmuramoyl-tripeptide--D-alanyl-D-alanine ligase
MMLLSEAAAYMDGEFLCDEESWLHAVGSDTRNISKGELFFALKGEHFNGNDYAQQALNAGAAAVVIDDVNCKAKPAILVKDSKKALGDLAKAWRMQFDLPIIGVTGSNGKTTVKEMITAILAAKTNDRNAILATVGNLNNDIGMPMTLLKIRETHAFAVIEMGMNHLQEIDYLTRIARPTVAVITNAGTAHIGEVGSRDNIAKAKGEIYAGLAEDGVAVINADDDYASYWQGLNKGKKIISFGIDKDAEVSATYVENNGVNQVQLATPNGSISFTLNLLGKHNVTNALAASACAVALGISNADIALGLSNFGGVKGRLQRKNGINGAALIDDTYNANPDSMKAAIDVLATQAGRQIFVMGDMAELGDASADMHAEIGAYAKQKGIAQLLALGDMTKHAVKAFGAHGEHFASLEASIHAASRASQKDAVILVKGSRFMQMERVVAAIEEKMAEKSSKNTSEKAENQLQGEA